MGAVRSEGFILDTSAYSAFMRGNESLRPYFSTEKIILIPTIVLGELKVGFAHGTKQVENEALLTRFMQSPNVFLLSLRLRTTEKYAEVFTEARKGGISLSANDLWIAALSLEYKIPLLTLDADFSRLASIRTLSI